MKPQSPLIAAKMKYGQRGCQNKTQSARRGKFSARRLHRDVNKAAHMSVIGVNTEENFISLFLPLAHSS
jgi:hypothetical protein